jgi:hypothetical protein
VIPTPSGGVRLVGALIRRADRSLAHSAARNAAASVADRRARHLEELRTLRDLQAVQALAATVPAVPRRPRTDRPTTLRAVRRG